jgi:membrane associated rhomboid family serine protease
MYLTYIIIGITVAISLYAFKERTILQKFIMNPYYTAKRNEYHRFLTSGFVHNDHMHLIVNMISLYFFGLAVEMVFDAYFEQMGKIYFVLLYLLGIVVSDIPTYLKHRNNPHYNSLGASGGVAAVIFAFILFRPLDNIYLYMALPIPGFILGTLYIVFSWYQGRKSNDNINHDAHLYGALFGLVFCVIIYPASISNFFEQIRNWDILN